MRLDLLGRHQVAALIGTSADFTAMIALVELARLAPPGATVMSALVGGLVNFSVSRAWAFRKRHRGTVASQAARYAMVSLGGALLNGLLLAAVLAAASFPYVFARVGVAVSLSVLYTYPLHTRVVFRVAT
jgi:putative flippase GtrA